jgi:hypothetical protein
MTRAVISSLKSDLYRVSFQLYSCVEATNQTTHDDSFVAEFFINEIPDLHERILGIRPPRL